MSLTLVKSHKKIYTEPSHSKEIHKIRAISSKTLYHQPKLPDLLVELRKFPDKCKISQLIFKKISINLDMAKKRSMRIIEEHNCSPKKILPHQIQSRKQFTKLTGLKSQKQKVLNDDNLIHITAQKWLIYDCKKGQAIKGFKHKKKHDVASLSKLLTFYTAFMIVKQYRLSIDKIDFIVMKEDQQLGGTKIPLQQENIIKLQDCLYAMLLNSANNAATVLANNLGFFCLRKRDNLYFSCFDIDLSNRRKNIDFFVSLMKTFAQKLDLIDTQISNPHGMSGNISTGKDIARLFQVCYKIPLFCKIIETKQRAIQVRYVDENGNLKSNKISLRTTNKMFQYNKFCKGAKTGQNKTGGNSLVSYFTVPQTQQQIIIVVLGSFGRYEKFRDTDRLYQYLIQKND